MLRRARAAIARLAEVEGRAAPYYGLASGIAVAVPLLVGSATGHTTEASVLALGAYLVALRAPEGPYGARARNLASAILVVSVGALIGGVLSGHPWLAVLAVPPIIALGTAVPWIGPTAGLAVLLTAIRPAPGDVLFSGFMELLGALLTSLLFLAPWPARRLRPLRATLAEAADAVAFALDAVAEDIGAHDAAPLKAVEPDDPELAAVTRKADWEKARRAASQALTSARATSGFYRSGRGRSEPTRPERLIEALARIMQETVALRSLTEAARRTPPQRPWEQEARVAIAALAARVRLVAGVIGLSGEAPLGEVESAAVRRLGRQTEAIRRASLAGDEDLVAVALIVEIRRSVERLAGGVNAARRLAAGGVKIGFGPPRLLPDTTGPVWGRLGRAIRTRSPRFREVTRVGLMALLAMTLATALALPHGHWMTITAMLSLRGTYAKTVQHLLRRVGGTAVGSAIAAVLLALVSDPASTAVIMFVLAFVGFSMRTVNLAYWWLFSTPLTMMLLDFSIPSGWATAGQRIGLTFAGGLLAFLAVRLLWPTGYVERLPVLLGRMVEQHAQLARAAAAVVEQRSEGLELEKLVAAEKSADGVADARARLGHERLPDDDLLDRLGSAVAAANRTRDHLIAISRMSREQEVDAGPLAEILERMADALEEAADAMDDPDFSSEPPHDAPSPDQRLDEEFASLETHLAALARRRRSEIKAGVPTDVSTPLRHALLQASGTRHAVRSLRGDAEALIENSRASLVSPSASGT